MSLQANYFELFDLPLRYQVDTNVLAERFRTLQRTVHPDKYANAPDKERRLALQHAAQINAAFTTLKNPLQRGQYLLQLNGVELDDTDTSMPTDFLMQQMELREEIADIQQQADVNALSGFLTKVQQQQQQLQTELSQQFTQQDFNAARDSVRKMQFFDKIYAEALSLEENLLADA